MDFMNESAAKRQLKILCGLIITVTVLQPLSNLDISSFGETKQFQTNSIRTFTQEGELMARNALALRIKEETESYILKEAVGLNADISVDVTVSDEDIPVPASVSLSGRISPFAREQLTDILWLHLGIPREKQIWTG